MSERNTDPIRVAPGSMTIEPLFPAPQAPRPPKPSPEQLAQVEEAQRRDQDLQRWHAEQEAKAPGRFSLVDEREVTARQEDWRKRNASTGVGGDIWRGLQIGADKIPRAVREVVRALPAIGPGIVAGVDQIDRWATGRDSETLLEEKEQRLRAGQTPAQQAAGGKQWVEETVNPDGSVSYAMGSAWTDPRSYLGAVVESLPGTVITMVPAAALARGAYVGAMARGLGERAAAAAAARTAMIAGGVGEGVLAGGETSAEVREAIAKMPEETLRQSQAYRTLIESGQTPEQARAAIADDRAVKGMLIAGVATGLFGGMGDRALAKIVAEGVQGGIGRRTIAGAARGLVAEGVFEELPQSVAEQMAKNYALQGANPNQRLMEGVPNAAAGGLVVGGIMGSGIGGAAGAARPGGVLPATASEAEAKGQAIATGAVEGPTGPISAALDYGSRQGGATTAPDGAPPAGTEVAIRMARGQTLPGRIEGYSPTGEPLVRAEITDPETGEVTTQTLEVPLSQLAPVRPAVLPAPVVASDPEAMPQGIESQVDPSAVAGAEAAPVSTPGDPRARTERPYTDTIAPDEVTAEAAEPAGRIAPTETSDLPDRKDTVPLLERPFNARPGARVIVDDPGTVGRFGATIQAISADGQSALVRGDNGIELEMPSDRLRVSGLSAKQVEARELAANPPVERETITGTVPTAREVRGKQMVMPDELHARLYDLGKMRHDSKRTLGRGALDLDTDRPAAEAVQLAERFGVSPQRLAQIAEDYRYRVERAAKETASRTPVRMPAVSDKMLQRMKAENRREAAKAAPEPEGNQPETQATPDVARDAPPVADQAPAVDEVAPAVDRPVAQVAVTASPVDAAANEAATSPTNDTPEPTAAQAAAGNYKVGRIRLAGLDISIENPAGSQRKGVDRDGKAWSVTMKSHYGYFRGTRGPDKDHIDVFVRPGIEALDDASPVFVVDQVAPDTGKFDEPKVMLGWSTAGQARQAYSANYAANWRGLGAITATDVAGLKRWFDSGKTETEFAAWAARAEEAAPDASSQLQARDDGDAGARGVGSSQAAVSQSQEPRLPEVRGTGDMRSPSVDEGLPGVLPGDRPAPDAGALGGPDRRESGVRAGQRPMGDADAAVTEPTAVREERAGGDGSGGRAPRRGEALDGVREARKGPASGASREPRPQDGGDAATASDARRADDVSPRVGAEIGAEQELAAAAPESRVDTGAGSDNADARKATAPNVDFSGNKLFTADKVEAARARLRAKMRQVNSGIDPETLVDGMTIAGAYIEAGVRSFSDYARRMVEDLGPNVRPYLLSFWEGSRHYPGLDTTGMTSAAESAAQHQDMMNAPVDTEATTAEETTSGEPSELGRSGPEALAGVPAEPVRGSEGGGEAGGAASGRGGEDVRGSGRPGARRDETPRSVRDGEAGVSVPAGRAGPPEDGPAGAQAEPREAVQAAASPSGVEGEVRREVREAGDGDAEARNTGGGDSEAVKAPQPSGGLVAQARPTSYTITDADELGSGGAKAKYRGNVAAIRLLRKLDAEARPATRDEQSVLAKWVGWGGLRVAFPREDGSTAKGWEKEAAELKEILTAEEYRAAESSTRNAHYTAPEIVKAMWSAVDHLGFKGGQILEPSVGAGNFLGLAPAAVRKTARFTGAELDRVTGMIAKNLYLDANIQAPVGYQDLRVPDGYFDLAIGNPPFGSERLHDRLNPDISRFSIHNYFFAKSVNGLRPGGVLAMVVTSRFLDGADRRARSYIADRADLIGAIRLPNDAFLRNANTSVTTDIVFLQRREEGVFAADMSWVDVGTFTDRQGRTVPLNRYFIGRPDMMLGEFGAYGTMYARDELETALISRDGDNLPQLVRAAIQTLPPRIMPAPTPVVATETIRVPQNVRDALEGSMFLDPDGQIWKRDPDRLGEPRASLAEIPGDTGRARVAQMIRVRDAFARLRAAQLDPKSTDEKLDTLRERLNKVYDAHVAKFGPINADANKRLFRDDPTWPQISALEDNFDKGISKDVAKKTGETARAPSAKKTAIFSKRTQQPYAPPTSASSAKDALAAVLSEYGRVDMRAMEQIYGRSEADIVTELGSLIFRTPAGTYETANAYLSGNVKQKLAEAQRAAVQDPAFRANVAALQDVQPADIDAVDIDAKAGAPWVPEKHVANFIDHIIDGTGSKAIYSKLTASWIVTPGKASQAATTQWSTDRASINQIVAAALNHSRITVSEKNTDGSTTIDAQATEAANEKVEQVKAQWRRWIWEDDARRDELARIYNDTFNTDVDPKFDGSHLKLPGKVGDNIIQLRPHQKNAVWRALTNGLALFDHTVGSGKTITAIASIMEMRRTGQAKKPMVVVPNHLVGQWATDFIKLYPGAKVLAPTEKDFDRQNRQKLFARIGTSDWDAIIVAHSSFKKIGVSKAYEEAYIADQVAQIMTSMQEMKAASGERSRNVSQLSKMRDRHETRLKALAEGDGKDVGLVWDDLGIDLLTVDEAHEFKNLEFTTSMQRVAGLGNPGGSQKAADLAIKIRHLLDTTGGRNLIFLTGTPISNSMAEMFTMQRYLAGRRLDQMGLSHFDAWARVFGEVVSDWELSPTGQYKLNSRFARFTNVPELMQLYRSFADVIVNDDIKAMLAAQGKRFPLPKVKGGKPTNIVVERSDDQAAFIGSGTEDANGNLLFEQGSLIWRAENLPKKVEKGSDNMLKIMSDARKAALDMRLIDSAYGDAANSKVHRAADEMVRIYRQSDRDKGTQLVFIDLSTPQAAKAKEGDRIRDLMAKADRGDEAAQEALDKLTPDELSALDGKFSVYDDLRQKLIDRGIPPAEIAFIHSANTDLQKQELFGKVRSGRVRLLFGSTPKMGAGTNVQDRMVALHHMDAPWRPSDLEQRDGRGIRQGNKLYEADPDGFEIEILRYATKNTLDARQWQTIEAKARFIEQLRKGNVKSRTVEDIAGEASNAAEMKAAASGNPLILEEMTLRQQIRKLESAAVEHDRNQHRVKGTIGGVRREINHIETTLPDMERDAATAAETLAGEFTATIRGAAIGKPSEMGAAIIAAAKEMLESGAQQSPVGSYGPFKLTLKWMHTRFMNLIMTGAMPHDISVGDVTEADPNGLGLKVTNTARWMVKQPEQMQARLGQLRSEIPKLEQQIGPFAQAAEFSETKARHNEVLTALRPKPKPPAPKAEDAPKNSVRDGEPVATIDGTELGVEFRGPDDMPALRRAALAWFNDNLRGTTALMSDGTEVRFNRRGGGKITSNSKGDMLLRMVPAIRAIIEQGRVVRREPGTKAGVIERVIVAAPVNFDGAVQNMAVSVHRHSDGQWQYDFTMDRDERAGGPAIDAGGLATREGPVPGLEVLSPRRASDPGSGTRLTPDDDAGGSAEGAADRDSVSADTSNLNLFVYNEAPAGAASADIARVQAVLDRSPLAPMVRKLMAAGRLEIVSQAYDGAADGVQAFTAPDGRIQLVAPMLADADVLPVLLHEAFHAGARRLIGDAAWEGLTSRLDRLHRQFERSPGGARTFYDAARRRVGNAGVTGTLTAEEFGAYAIEHYEAAPRALRGWVDDMLGRVKAWALAAFGRQIGTVTPAQLRALAVAALRDQARGVDQNPFNSADQNPIKTSTSREVRARGIPATAVSLATLRNDQPLKAHPDYEAAKAGDAGAAVRAVQALVRDSDLAAAQKAFGAGAVYVPVMAVEASGNNKLPHALAALYATRTNGTVADGMFQNNRAFHTGASAMERIANRARFIGDVVPGSRYVLVDDVTVMGSTLADLADHIQRGGGQVSGVVTLVNASRGEVLSASASAVRDIEKRFGNAVEDLFGIAPASLTAPEAAYLRNFRDADALRARAAAAGVERSNRLRAKGVLGQAADAGPSRQVSDPTKPRDSVRDRAADVVSSAGAMLDRRSLVETVRGIGTDIQPALLATVPLNYFSELKRPGMTSVEAYLRTKRDMDTYRANRHETMVTIAETWRKFAGANRAGAETLSQLMNEATLASFDPSAAQPDPANGAQVAIAKLWNDLPPSAQKLYRDVRDAFVEQQTELDAVILANVDKAQLVAQRKVEQAYRSNLEKIRRNPDLTEAEKRERIEKLEGQRENDLLRGQWAHKARMTRLRQQFESKRLPAPYFPLTRFGRYFVTIRNGEGDVVSFSRFEREAERRRWVRENWSKIQQDYSGAVKEEGVIDQAADLGRAMDPRVIGEIDILLGDAGVDANVMDAIWQRYLQTMPDLSIRKRFIHRKGTSGFQADALKGFASHMFHAAHQMARLKYAGDLTEALNGAADEARKSDDPTRATTLVNEMRKRHGFILNPTGSRAVQAVTSAMFAWYLAATPAAAIVNLTQTPMLGIPIIGARFGGMAKAAAAMSKAATETANSSGSIQNSTSLSREEQAAVRAFYESGLIERTQSHDLAGIGETGVEYSPLRHQIMSKIGWMFHRAEIWNREVTALTAYRMARDNGLTHREAIDTAHDLTWKVHFDYSNTNRARILQGDFAKILTVFQNFQLNMWYRLFRDMHQSFKGETPQARKEARHQLGGIIGMMGLLGGVTGIAGYNVIMAVAGMFFGDEEDPFGFKHQVERSILDLLGPTLGGVVLKGGIGQMTGIDLTSRIGMPDFFLREPNGNKEGAEWFKELLFNAAGVVPSTAYNMYRGFTMIGDGKSVRGIEVIAPKAIRDLMKAYRYANEGVQSHRGDEVVPVDRISGWDVIAQASGFTPAHIAESFDRNSRLRNAQTKVQRERRDLLNQFGLASKMNDADTRDAVLERIRAWNSRAYTVGFAITSDTLRQSLATRQRAAARREDGVLISNPTLNRTLRDGLGPRIN